MSKRTTPSSSSSSSSSSGRAPKKSKVQEGREEVDWDATSSQIAAETKAAVAAGGPPSLSSHQFFPFADPSSMPETLLRASLQPPTELDGLVPLGKLPPDLRASLGDVYQQVLTQDIWPSLVNTDFLLKHTYVKVNKDEATGEEWLQLARFVGPGRNAYLMQRLPSIKEPNKEIVTVRFTQQRPSSGDRKGACRNLVIASPPATVGSCDLFVSKHATDEQKQRLGRIAYGSFANPADFAHRYNINPEEDCLRPERIQRSFSTVALPSKAAPALRVVKADGSSYEVGGLAVVFDLYLDFLAVWCVLDALEDPESAPLVCQAMPCVNSRLQDISTDMGLSADAQGVYPRQVLAKFRDVVIRSKTAEIKAMTAVERKSNSRYIKNGGFFQKTESQGGGSQEFTLVTHCNYSFPNVDLSARYNNKGKAAGGPGGAQPSSNSSELDCSKLKFTELLFRDMRRESHPLMNEAAAMKAVRNGSVVTVGFTIRASFDPLSNGAFCLKRVPKLVCVWDASGASKKTEELGKPSALPGWEGGGFAPDELDDEPGPSNRQLRIANVPHSAEADLRKRHALEEEDEALLRDI